MHKSGKHLSKKKKKETVDPHPMVTIELCNSSEDEAGLIEHTSDLEEHPPHSLTPIEELQDEDHKIEDRNEDIKAGTEFDSDDNATSDNFLTEIGLDKDISSPEKDESKFVNSFFQVTEISAADQINSCEPSNDVVDSGESVSSNTNMAINNTCPDRNFDKEIAEEIHAKKELHDQESSDVEMPVFCASPDTTTCTSSAQGFVPLDQSVTVTDSSPVGGTLMSPSLPAAFSPHVGEIGGTEELPETNQETCHVSVEKAVSPVKPVPIMPIQKIWDRETVGDISLAELYLMLGKPSLFKLCYQWKEIEQEDKFLVEKEKSTNQKLSPGVAALVQYANLMLSKIQKDNTANSLAKEPDKSSSAKSNHPSSVNIGIQCSLLDKRPKVWSEVKNGKKIVPKMARRRVSNTGQSRR